MNLRCDQGGMWWASFRGVVVYGGTSDKAYDNLRAFVAVHRNPKIRALLKHVPAREQAHA